MEVVASVVGLSHVEDCVADLDGSVLPTVSLLARLVEPVPRVGRPVCVEERLGLLRLGSTSAPSSRIASPLSVTAGHCLWTSCWTLMSVPRASSHLRCRVRSNSLEGVRYGHLRVLFHLPVLGTIGWSPC